jgi:hypothetical protein
MKKAGEPQCATAQGELFANHNSFLNPQDNYLPSGGDHGRPGGRPNSLHAAKNAGLRRDHRCSCFSATNAAFKARTRDIRTMPGV